MWRNYDWACPKCNTRQADLVNVPVGEDPPKHHTLECPIHGKTKHYRAPSLPAPYMGEKVFNPVVCGGTYDTQGRVAAINAPDLPGAAEHNARVAREITTAIDAGLRGDDLAAARGDAMRDSPTDADYVAQWTKPEVKEIEAKNKVIAEQNAEKRARSAAGAAGQVINMRRDKCAGDSKNLFA